MTAAGLAVLFITLDYAHASDFARPGVAANHPTLRRINRGLEWMDENYKPSTNGYNMVGVERVALASGRKYFNNEDWYRTGAKAFIDKMNNNGQIGGGGHGGNIVNTAFALVFLSRGRVPVFVNKLEIDGYAWNNRPQDMAKLTAWASDELEIPMNWQIIDFRHDPSEWMDAPFLYLSGHTPLALNEDQLAKLRKYINLGGTLVTTADGNSQEFTNSVIETFQQMYADDGLKFSQVAADDPLMSLHYPVRNMEVLSLHNGIRHMVIHVPRGDIGWTFQSGNEREATPWNFMANVFQYSIEKKKPKNRLESYYVAGEGGGKTVHVGQARYDGKWNPEPLGWERFGDLSTAVDPVPHSVDLSAIGDADVSMVHVAGSEAVNFSADQIAAMREYVDGGGVIVFEAVGGSEPYFSAVRKMLVEAFPGKQLGKLSRHSDVITGTGGGTNASKVNYRLFYTQTLGFADDSPSLLAMEFDGQPRIIVSPDDLTGGMMGLEKWGIFGYEPESAQKLMGNIALWASRINPASGAIEAPVEEAAAE
jgi:hypothetical protein